MKKELRFSFFSLGVTSVITQVLVIRECIASFYGNEFFVGWVLFGWLFWTAAGSAFANKYPQGEVGLSGFLAFSFVAIAVGSFLEILLLRSSRFILGTIPGALPDLIPALLYSFLALAPLCFLLGLQFSLIVRSSLLVALPRGEAKLGEGYFYESLGFVTGGLIFSFIFVHLNVFYVLNFVFALNFWLAVLTAFPGDNSKARASLLACLGVVTLMIIFASPLDIMTSALRFPSETLELTRNTVHGNISVTSCKKQRNFYQNGTLIGSDHEDLSSELLAHFPMLAHPSPRKVVIFGAGFNGPILEVLKHHPSEVMAVDIDPEMIRIAEERLPQDLQTALKDPAVHIVNQDPRKFFDSFTGKADVIIMNSPNPSTVLVNRNFTLEFFRKALKRLSPGGILALRLDFSPNYISPELERLGSSVYATLQQVFPSVTVLPEDTAYFLASFGGLQDLDPDLLIQRVHERDLQTNFVTAELIRDRITNDRVKQVQTIFSNALEEVKNTDLRPRSCYFSFLRWLSQFHPRISQKLLRLTEIPFGAIVLVFLFVFHVIWAGGRKSPEKWSRKQACRAMSAAGFSVMTLEIALIYLFQVVYGDLYYRIAWLITAFMVGMGAGAFLGARWGTFSARRTVAWVHFFTILIYGSLAWSFHGFLGSWGFLKIGQGLFFYMLATLSGGMAGFEFPYACRLYLQDGEGKGAGTVYAADLWGSALGAVITAGFLIPIWGLPRTFALLALLNGSVLLLFIFRKNLGRKNI